MRILGFTLRRATYATLGLTVFGSTLAYANFEYWNKKQPAEYFIERLSARVRPAVRSPNGELVGVIPPADGAPFSLNEVGVDLSAIPNDFYRILTRLEDSHSGQWYRGHILGVDYFAIPTRIVGGLLKAGKPAGASTLWMQVASLANNGKKTFATGERKLREYAGATVLYNAYGGDTRRVAHAYANIASYGYGLGGDVIGLAAAADVIFGVGSERLTRAQNALLASAANLPLILGDHSEIAKKRWAYHKRRATDGLRAEFGTTEAATAIAEINAMGDFPPTRAVLKNLALAATGTIAGRTRALVLPLLPAIRADLNTTKEMNHAIPSN